MYFYYHRRGEDWQWSLRLKLLSISLKIDLWSFRKLLDCNNEMSPIWTMLCLTIILNGQYSCYSIHTLASWLPGQNKGTLIQNRTFDIRNSLKPELTWTNVLLVIVLIIMYSWYLVHIILFRLVGYKAPIKEHLLNWNSIYGKRFGRVACLPVPQQNELFQYRFIHQRLVTARW